MLALEVATQPTLSVRTFTVHEALHEPFRIEVVARCADPSLDLEAIVGRPASFTIESEVANATYPKRTWPSICRAATLERVEPSGHSTYRFHLVPALWLLSQRRNHRVFSHRTAPEIVKELLDEWAVQVEMVGSDDYPKLPYKVQYGESDLEFIARVLEEAGSVFWFDVDPLGTSRLVVGDRLEARLPRDSAIRFADDTSTLEREEWVTDVRIAERVRPGSRVVTDFDLRRPGQTVRRAAGPVAGPDGRLEHHEYRPGGFLVEVQADGSTPVADDGGAARHEDRAGQSLAERSLDALRADRFFVHYRTNVLDSWPGRVLGITEHAEGSLGATNALLVTEFRLEGAAGEAWSGHAAAVSTAARYRPPLRARRPRARVQSARVAGNGPIDTDEFGRVLVRFPWDRGAASSSTLRVRVNHAWAGAGFGYIKHPRVGEEVLVDFLGGDPEQPIVVGRVFNLANPVIEGLPDGATRSVWRSNSTGSAGGNELNFEDASGSELLQDHAAKDARRLIKHDDTSTTSQNRDKSVGGDELETTEGTRTQVTSGNRSESTGRDRTTAVVQSFGDLVKKTENDVVEGARLIAVGGDLHLIVDGDEREQTTSDASLIVSGDRKESVAGIDSQGIVGALVSAVGSYVVDASGPNGTIHLFAGGPIVIESASDVSLLGGGGFVTASAAGVAIRGTLVLINEGGSPGSLPAASPSAPDPAKAAAMTPEEPAAAGP
jgi:type VI secretion system secreted protein VgrG